MAYQPKSYRKFLATGVATAMVATAVAPAVSADEHVETSFTDVPEGSWYADNLAYTVERGIIEGYADNTFRPDGQITRAEAAAVLTRAKDLEVSADPSLDFSDTSDSQWYAAYVDAVVEAGYMQGDPGGTFRPNQPMSRGEFATVMVNAFDLERNTSAIVDFSDLDPEDSTQWYYDNVMTLASLGIVGGFTDGTFRAENNVNRAEATAFVHRTEVPEERLDVEVDELQVSSVTAVNSTTVQVNFNQAVEDIDFTNFSVNGGKTVVDASLSDDARTATVRVNSAFTRNQTYTLTASDIMPAGSSDSYDFEETFTWSVDDGIDLSFETTSLDVGQTERLRVRDQDGRTVSTSEVELTSSNENIVATDTTDGDLDDDQIKGVAAGTAEVTARVRLQDGTVLRNTFVVSVEAADTEVENRGFTLVENNLENAPANTVDFENSSHKTSIEVSDATSGNWYIAMYDEVGGNPQAAPVEFDEVKNIRNLNPTIAEVDVDGDDQLELTTNSAGRTGEASFEITFEDDTTRTFTVDVVEDAEQDNISLDRTSLTLSDETASGDDAQGVNYQIITIDSLDQYEDLIDFEDGRVTVTVNTEGLEIGVIDDVTGDFVPASENVLDTEDGFDFSGNQTDFVVRAKEGEIVSGNVRVNYFEDESDESPKSTENVSVNVVDVDSNATKVSLDIVAPSTIDANGDNLMPSVPTDIDYSDQNIYVLDSEGNRLDAADTDTNFNVTFSDGESSDWVEVNGDTLEFKNDALTYMSTDDDISLTITADGITRSTTVDYENSAYVPAKANVNSNAIAIELDDDLSDTISLEQILFGVVDENQVLVDDVHPDPATNDFIYAISNNASNGGYKYNTPLVSIYNNAEEQLPTGANVYGVLATDILASEDSTNSGNFWNDGGSVFSVDGFDFDVRTTNRVIDGGAGTEISNGNITIANDGDTVSFTLVVEAIWVENAAALSIDNVASKLNLLDSPVTLNVTVTK